MRTAEFDASAIGRRTCSRNPLNEIDETREEV